MDTDMTKRRPLPIILRFAIPLIIGNMVQQLYNMADTMIVGRFVGAGALAAVGSTGTIMFLVLGFAIGLTSGFTVLTSQSYGAHNAERTRHSVANAIILAAIMSVALSILSVIFMRPILRIMNTPSDIFEDAWRYITVICAGMTATVFYNLFSAMLRAVGNSTMPLIILVISSCLNVLLDFLFILAFNMGTAGAALATVLAQGISALLCLIHIFRKEDILRPRREDWHLSASDTGFQLRIGLPMALQYAITASGTMIMQAALNTFGSTAVAAISAATKAMNLFLQAFPSMGQAMAAYVGQNYGAGDMERVKKGTQQSVIATGIIALICSVLVLIMMKPLMSMFFSGDVDLEEMYTYAKPYIYGCASMMIPLALIFIYRNVLQACGLALLPTLGGVTELLTRIIGAVFGIVHHSYLAAVLCDPAAWGVAGVYFLIVYRYSMNKRLANAR